MWPKFAHETHRPDAMKTPMEVLLYSHKDKLQGVVSAGSTYTNHAEEANGGICFK